MDAVTAWVPPDGMDAKVAREWRTFYRSAFTTYGITPAQYRDLYLAQAGRCYICRVAKGKHPDDPKGRGTRRLGVDHNHAIGYGKVEAVRALLCTGGDRTCNRIIGWLGADALGRAREVLEYPPAQRVIRAVDDLHEALAVVDQDERDELVKASLGIRS